jgi:subtilisin family serine protease
MKAHRKKKSNQRNERHGAAWGGGRLLPLMLILLTSLAFGQTFRPVSDERGFERGSKMTGDLADMLKNRTSAMRVIVTYKNAPGATQISRAQGRGATLNHNLSFVKAGAFTMSPAAIRALANDSDVDFISPDRPLKAMDDLTDSAVGVSSAWNTGLDGTGIGVAIIDSGINDTHDDLEDGNGVSRVVYHQDFTGTSTTNSSGAKWDLYGHGTHVAGIVARMLEKNPLLTQSDVEAILKGTALPIPPSPGFGPYPAWDERATGAGLAQGAEAVAATPLPPLVSPSGRQFGGAGTAATPSVHVVAQGMPMEFRIAGFGDRAHTLRVFDVQGRLVRHWPSSTSVRETWDGARDDGTTAPSGVYFVVARGEGIQRSAKLVLAR